MLNKWLAVAALTFFVGACDVPVPYTEPFSEKEARSINVGDSKSVVLEKMSTNYSGTFYTDSGNFIINWFDIKAVSNERTYDRHLLYVYISKDTGKVIRVQYMPKCRGRTWSQCPTFVKTKDGLKKMSFTRSQLYKLGEL